MYEINLWYEELLKRCLNGELSFECFNDTEGLHDCIMLNIDESSYFEYEGRVYLPRIIAFYGDVKENGDIICKKETGYIYDIYTFTNDGYSDGLYLDNEDESLFKSILKLINKRIEI